MADSTVVFLVLAGLVVVLVVDVVPAEVAALGSALVLWATGVLELDQALAGFGNPTVVFVASLLVVATALDRCGSTAWAGQLLAARAGGSTRRLTVATMALAAALTSIITVNGAVATLVPVVVATAARVGVPTSSLLLPLAYAAHAGSQLALTGSQVNILYSEAARDAGAGYFGFFEYTLVGLPLVAGAVVIVATLGPRLLPARSPGPDEAPPADRWAGTVELVVPSGSRLVGTAVEPGRATPGGHAVVLVVHRDGRAAGPGRTVLAAGDVLLVRGDHRALADDLGAGDVTVIDDPADPRHHGSPWAAGARRTAGVLAALVVLLATGALPPAVAGLLAAGALVVTRVLRVEDAYRINWSVVVLIAAMIPMSTAMAASGAADDVAEAITRVVGDGHPHLLLVVLFVVVAGLGQLMSNTATALVAIPIAVAAAEDLGVSVRPVLMSLNVVTVAALLTPVATAANTMVLRPGGYRFTDYTKLGLPLVAWWFVVAVGLVPLIWPF